MGVHPSGLHHLEDLCLIRHLCLDHRLKTRAKVGTLIPQFHWNQPLQGRLLLSWNLMISISLRHLPQDLLLKMIQTPHMNFLILIQTPMIHLCMIKSKSHMGIWMIAHQEFDITTQGMEGSCLGTGITLLQSDGSIWLLPLWNGTIGLAILILTILFSKNFFNRTKGYIRHHPLLPCQGSFLIRE